MKHDTVFLRKFKDLQIELAKFGVTKRRDVAGLLEMLWTFTAINAQEGNVGKFTDEQIADELEWDEAEPAELMAILVATGWLDEDREHRLLVHDWADHAADYIKKRLKRKGSDFAKPSNSLNVWTTADMVEPTADMVEPTADMISTTADNGGHDSIHVRLQNPIEQNRTKPNHHSILPSNEGSSAGDGRTEGGLISEIQKFGFVDDQTTQIWARDFVDIVRREVGTSVPKEVGLKVAMLDQWEPGIRKQVEGAIKRESTRGQIADPEAFISGCLIKQLGLDPKAPRKQRLAEVLAAVKPIAGETIEF